MLNHGKKHHATKHKRWTVPLLLCIIAAVSIYVVHLGNTDSWPETGCTVTSSRVVKDYLDPGRRAIALYKVEYELRYTVGTRNYYIWAKSGTADVDQRIIQDRASSLRDECDFRIRYNPSRPSEGVAVRKH